MSLYIGKCAGDKMLCSIASKHVLRAICHELATFLDWHGLEMGEAGCQWCWHV
jgi:hypothetical protein